MTLKAIKWLGRQETINWDPPGSHLNVQTHPQVLVDIVCIYTTSLLKGKATNLDFFHVHEVVGEWYRQYLITPLHDHTFSFYFITIMHHKQLQLGANITYVLKYFGQALNMDGWKKHTEN